MGGDRFCRFGLAAGEPALRAHQTNLVPRVTLVKEGLLVVLHALPGIREGEITIIIFLLRAGVRYFSLSSAPFFTYLLQGYLD